MSDELMVEIYALALESFFGGQKSFQLHAYPFRMTPRNMARHRNSPHLAFWKNLKTGYDHFEVSHQQPNVDVCDRRYVFDAVAADGSDKPLNFSPRAKCPVYQVSTEIADLMRDRREREGAEFAQLVNNNIALAENRTGVDGGMNPVFMDQLNSAPSTDGLGTQVALRAPGSLPRTPNQPPAQVVPPVQNVQVASAGEDVSTSADVPVPRSAPQAKEGSAPQAEGGIAGLIGNMFSGGSNNATAAAPTQPAPKPAARPRTAVAAAKPAATMRTASASASQKPQAPHASTVATASKTPALRPSVKDEPAVAEAKPQAPAQAAPQPEMRTAFQTTPRPKSGMLSGAQPVVPSGSFESRWSAFRSF
jgi:hypothetical protein